MNKIPQNSTLGKVLRNIKENHLIESGDRIVVAVSGGADSIALLSILLELKEVLSIQVSACHFDHRLRGEASEADAKFTADFCHSRGVELIFGQAAEKNSLKNEDEARKARYTFFEKILGEGRGDKIAIAHNQNDLSETLILRLIRGSGISGLRSIPQRRKNFIRPLLPISRNEIEQYLEHKGLKYCTDKTNFDPKFLRNRVRLELLPLFSKLNPNILETLSGTIQSVSDDYDFLEASAREKLQKISKAYTDKIVISREDFLILPTSQQRLVLRLAAHDLVGLEDITMKQLEEVLQVIEKGAGGKHKLLPHSLRIELAGGKIMILKIS